jgi:hypothetical protein
MAAATAIGSFVYTYSYADAVADLRLRSNAVSRRPLPTTTKLASSPVFVRQDEAIEIAKSLRDEHAHRGEAAK